MIYGKVIEYNTRLVAGLLEDDDGTVYNFFRSSLVDTNIAIGDRVMFEMELEDRGIKWVKGVQRLKNVVTSVSLDDFA